MKVALKVFLSILLFATALEFFLRVAGTYKSKEELEGNHYKTKYRTTKYQRLHQRTPLSIGEYKCSEFNYINKYNELGHREGSVDLFKKSSRTKVIAVGDSFTEGDGTSKDSSWVMHAERSTNNDIRFYNAGVCGSDIIFDYEMLSMHLISIKPDIIIGCINYSDVYDIIYKGDESRFDNTANPIFPSEYWYTQFHLVRAIYHQVLGYNSQLIKLDKLYIKHAEAINIIKRKLIETHNLCVKNSINYICIIIPTPYEINIDEPNKLEQELANLPFVLNIKEDVFKAMNPDYDNFYWKVNKHYNGLGYKIIGEVIAHKIDSLINNNCLYLPINQSHYANK
jgi:hypothetical protein